MSGFIDLHAHFLPGLDDGSPDASVSLTMLRALAELGFVAVTATPHQRAGMYFPPRDAIDAAYAATAAAARDALPHLAIGLAAENFLDDVFHERLRDGTLPAYPGGKAFLFEVTPDLLPPRLSELLFQVRLQGRLPVVAHPERYLDVQRDLGRAEAMARSAALLIDLGALDGANGRTAMKTARRLVEEGMAHAATSDLHSPGDVPAVAAGMAWIEKRLGRAALERLLVDAPRRILNGELP